MLTRPSLCVVALLLAFLMTDLHAANGFYVPGGGDGNWTTGGTNGDDGDWDIASSTIPTVPVTYPGFGGAGELASFDAAGPQSVTISADPGGPDVHIDGSASVTITLATATSGFQDVDIAAGGTLALTGNGTIMFASLLIGNGATLSVGANVTLIIGAPVTFGASTVVNSGVMRFDNNADFTGVTLTNTGTLRFDSTNQSNMVTTGGVDLGTTVDCVGAANTTTVNDMLNCTNLTLGSAGTVTFAGGVNMAGNLTQTSGTVNLGANSSIGNSGGDAATISGGSLDGTGFNVNFRDITVSGSGSVTTGSSNITGTTASFNTSGTIAIGNATFNSSATTTLTPDSVNDFTGDITVGSGTTLVLAGNLRLVGIFALNANNNLTINNGVLLRVDGNFICGGAGSLIVGTANPALDLRGGTVTFATVTITNNGGIVFDSTLNTVNVNNSNRLTGDIDTNEQVATGNTVAFDANTLSIATLDMNGNANVTFGAGVTTTGAVTRSGAGNATLTGAATFATTLAKSGGGTLALSGGGSITGDLTVTGGSLTSGGTLTLGGANVNFTGAGNITLGNVAFNRAGTTDLTLAAVDDLAGDVSIAAGTTLNVIGSITFFNTGALNIAATGTLELNNAAAVFTGVTVNNSGTINFDTTGTNITVTSAGQLGGVLGFIGGTGTTIFSTNPGASTLNITLGNTLRFTGATVFTGITVNNNGIINFQGTFNVTALGATNLGHLQVASGTVTFITAALTVTDFDLQGTANATVNLAFTSTGTTVSNTSTGVLMFTGAVTIAGNLENTGNGTVEIDAGGTVGGLLAQNNSIINVDGALIVTGDVTAQDNTTIDGTGFALDIAGNVSVTTTADFIAGNGTQIGGSTVTLNSTGTIQVGSVTFDRAGTTTLTYNQANYFTANFTVSDGTTLNATGNLTINGVLTVGSGAAATFDINAGNLTLTAATGTVAANGILDVGGSLTLTGTTLTVNGTLNLAGDLTETGNGTLAGAGTTSFAVVATININIDGTGTFSLTAATVAAATTVNQNGDLLLIGSVTLAGNGTWNGSGNTLGLAAAATAVTITVNTGSFAVDSFTAGNTAGADVTVVVADAGSFTIISTTVPLANAGGQNTLTLSETSTGTILITGDVTVASDDAGTQGDGGSLSITASSTVTMQGDVTIGTTGLGGADLPVDGCQLSLGGASTLILGPNAVTPTFAVGRNSILAASGSVGNEAAITLASGTAYAMTLDGGVNVGFLDIDGYDAAGLQLLANFGEVLVVTFTFNNVNFLGGTVGGTHLSVTPDLVNARGGTGVGQARFSEIHFDSDITDTGLIVTAMVVNTSSLKIANAVDDYGVGFTVTAVEAETTGVTGSIGGDNDLADEINNITWGALAQNNVVTVSNAPSNPFGVSMGLGTTQVLLIATFAAAGSDPDITVNSIRLTFSGNNIATNIENVFITFDTNLDGVGDSPFSTSQDPSGAGAFTFTGDTQVITNGTSMRMMVIGDIIGGADVDDIQVEIIDASLDVGTDVASAATGSADSGVRAIASTSGVIYAGTGNPGVQTANPGDIKSALHFNISVDADSPIELTLTSIRIGIQTNESGTNLAIDHIASLTLWQGNGDASLGGGEVLLETVDNGATANGWAETGNLVEVTFGPTNIVILPGAFQDFWVSITFTAVAVDGVPQPTYTVFIDNTAGDALNGGGTTAFQGIVNGGSINLATATPGDPLEKEDTYHDEDNSCELAAHNQGRLPLVLVLLLVAAAALGVGRRLRNKESM
ncbi:MAG: hypothetical protein IT462_15915 [Planctomycetes bacterium]|nr:hypothetical protein [Planctomycetota bacterium]